MAGMSKKERTHERIVESAARAIRKSGYDGVSVADIMKDAGLTHGGFYAHFPSRDALLAEAVEHAADSSRQRLERAALGEEGSLERLAAVYLGDAHVDAAETGCTLAALGSETSRQSDELKGLATSQVKAFASIIERALAGDKAIDAQTREEALVVLSTLVGALVLARAVHRPELSRAIRSAAKHAVAKKRRR